MTNYPCSVCGADARFTHVCRPPVAPPPASPEPMPEVWKFSPALGGAFVSRREDGGQYALSITLLRALLATQCLHICTEAERKVLELAPEVAANFGKPRSAELEIKFMRAVNDMLKEKRNA